MKRSPKNEVRFAVCILDDRPWFELGKVYRVLPDAISARMNCIRVVDEFHEDYVHPEDNFVFIDLPKEVQPCIPDLMASPRKPRRHSRDIASGSRSKPTRAKRASKTV